MQRLLLIYDVLVLWLTNYNSNNDEMHHYNSTQYCNTETVW